MTRIAPSSAALALTALVLSSCSTGTTHPGGTGGFDPPTGSAASRGDGMQPGARAQDAGAGLSLPPLWWRDTKVAESLGLTDTQLASLEALAARQENVARLESESALAARELRTIFDMVDVNRVQIVDSGARLRNARAALLDAQVELLASQREILSAEQWSMLKRTIQEQRRSERSEGRRPGRGGMMGGGPGGGRSPGW